MEGAQPAIEKVVADGEQLAEEAGSSLKDSGESVFRGLAENENPEEGLFARAPGAGNTPQSHVAGKLATQWISATKNINSPYAVTIKQPLFDRNMWARSENLAKTATYLLRRVRNIRY
jgi:hypothetical protein